MEKTIIVRPNEKVDGLTVRTLRVMKVIVRELGDRTERVDYGAIARELDLEWNNVKYAVSALVKAGILAKTDGKLTVLKKVVI